MKFSLKGHDIIFYYYFNMFFEVTYNVNNTQKQMYMHSESLSEMPCFLWLVSKWPLLWLAIFRVFLFQDKNMRNRRLIQHVHVTSFLSKINIWDVKEILIFYFSLLWVYLLSHKYRVIVSMFKYVTCCLSLWFHVLLVSVLHHYSKTAIQL